MKHPTTQLAPTTLLVCTARCGAGFQWSTLIDGMISPTVVRTSVCSTGATPATTPHDEPRPRGRKKRT